MEVLNELIPVPIRLVTVNPLKNIITPSQRIALLASLKASKKLA